MEIVDPNNLDRFLEAQDGIYDQALREFKNGRKQSHWMWFIFPQFSGLGTSFISKHFAIKSAAEAKDYLSHAVLGQRLIACAEAVLSLLTSLDFLYQGL